MASLSLDHLGLRKRSWQCCEDVNVIGDTAHAQGLAIQIATNRCQISVHARSYGGIEPGLAILRAKDNMNDDSTERLRHGDDNRANRRGNESRFQRCALGRNYFPGALPQASDECRAVGANRVQPSAADAFQVRSVAQQRFAKRLGTISGDQLRQITAALATVLKMHY